MSDRRPPPLPRQPSSPELVGIVTPDQPERGAVRHHPGVEDAPQAPPQRRGTLPGGMAAIPALTSGEFAPTLPAPNPLQKKTWRVPTPPSAALLARRTPVPPPDDPPAPQSAADGQLAAVLAERDRLRGELAQAQRDARAAAEAKLETYPPKVEPQRRPSPVPSSTPRADSIRPDGTVESLRKAQTRFYLGLGAFLAALALPTAAWLQSAAEAKARSQSADVRASAASSAADSAKATASNADKEIAKLRDDFRQYRANMREVFRLQGIDIPKRAPDDPDANDLKPVTPYCPKGKVCSGPQLVLQVAP